MGEQNDVVNDFFSKFDNEEENLVDFSESSTETKEVETKETKEVINSEETKADTKTAETETDEDKNTPFHKHPRWQEKLKENKELKSKQSEWEKEKQEMKERLEALESKPLTDEELEGMTPKEIQEYSRKQFEKEIAKKHELSTKEKEEAEKYIDSALETIKDNGFDLTDEVENELLKIADEYTEGNIEKAFELYQKLNDTKNSGKEEATKEAAKKKAAQSNRNNRGISSVGGFVRGTGWGNLNLK